MFAMMKKTPPRFNSFFSESTLFDRQQPLFPVQPAAPPKRASRVSTAW
jgi:hypothetical protein